jgi:signal peptidase I
MAWPPGPWEPVPSAAGPPRASAPALTWRDIAETAVLTLIVSVAVHAGVQSRQVEGSSMEPTLHTGERVLVNKLAYWSFGEPQRGDVVVFHAWTQHEDFIKRVIGLPGDTVEVKDNHVYVNDAPLEEPYLDQPTTGQEGPVHVGADEVFVMGDNRGNSSDSRHYGPLPEEEIVGKAWLRYWPMRTAGLIPDGDAFARDSHAP